VLKNQNLIKSVKFFAKLAITLGALYIVFTKIDAAALGELMVKANGTLLFVSFIFFFLAKIIEAFRSNFFFRNIGLSISEKANTKLYMLGMFYNLFFPGGIGGDSYRAYWIKKRYKIQLRILIGAFLINRINGLMALVSLLIISTLFISIEIPKEYLLTGLIPIAYLVYFGVLKKYLAHYVKTILPTSLLSFVIQMLQVFSAHLVLSSLGVSGPFGDYWFIYLLSGLAFIVPITVGGIGSREVVFLYGANLLNIDLNICIALSLLIYCMRAVASLAGAYFLVFPDKILNQLTE